MGKSERRRLGPFVLGLLFLEQSPPSEQVLVEGGSTDLWAGLPGTEFVHRRSRGEEHSWQLAPPQEDLGDPRALDHSPVS